MNFSSFELHSSELSPFRVFVLSNFPASFVNLRYGERPPDSKFLLQQLFTGLAQSYAHGAAGQTREKVGLKRTGRLGRKAPEGWVKAEDFFNLLKTLNLSCFEKACCHTALWDILL
jgi:hypothetical protein